MNVLSIYPSEDSEKAISNYTKQLIKAQEKQGIDITPLTYTAGNPNTLMDNLDFIISFERNDFNRTIDTIHIQHEYNLLGGYGLPFFELYKKLKKWDVKVITTMHNVLSQNEPFKGSKLKTFARKFLYRKQNKLIGEVSDTIIVHAQSFKDILVKEYNIPKEKVKVLPQGIQENIKLPSKAKAKKELNLKGPVYLLIGSLIPDHGADIIIKQAKEIGKTILVVANSKSINDRNDSRIRNWLKFNKDIVKENHSEKEVRFDIKELPYDLWWKYFAAADIVLLPYKGGIGSGILADCIATKKPMIGSNIKYFREFAKDWDFIRVSNTEADFTKLIKEVMLKDTYKKMEGSFKKYMAEFGLTPLAIKYKEVYFK